MRPASYRLYRVDGGGMIHDAEWFEAEDDAKAAIQISTKYSRDRCEIWHDNRFVAKVSPMPFDPDDPAIQKAVGDRLSAMANSIRRERETRA